MDRFGMIWAALMFTSAALNLIIALFFTPWWPLFVGIFPLASKFTLFAIRIAVVHVITQARLRRRVGGGLRSEEHTSELQSLMRISYAVFCLKKKKRDGL